MRRSEKEILGREEIDGIIRDSRVCRLGLARDNVPYIVPVCFGYDGTFIYFHTAGEGQKIDFMEANDSVCFEFEGNVNVIGNPTSSCKWSMGFESIIGHGRVQELIGEEDKIAGLGWIMAQYSDRTWEMTGKMVAGVRVWRINIQTVTGKRSGR
jgi:nitroimidazol reductase NimA-like FMN-containing flavoprotein (pyridoxamine 5'-phosphate oxidase superfamily)